MELNKRKMMKEIVNTDPTKNKNNGKEEKIITEVYEIENIHKKGLVEKTSI